MVVPVSGLKLGRLQSPIDCKVLWADG